MKLFLVALLGIFEAVKPDTLSANNALYRCGIRKRFGVQLIHHARTAELGQWPWHAAVYHRNTVNRSEYKCGATLIDQRNLITSAHCVVDPRGRPLKVNRLEIQLGKHGLYDYPDQVQIKNVSEIHLHPEYSPNKHDIALIVLETNVRFSEFVIPICLEEIKGGLSDDLIDQRGWVAGWGQNEHGTVSEQLKTAQMPVVSNTECVQSDPDLFGRFISQAIYCASDRNGTSVCLGDSGGGMYFNVGDHWELRGIVSFSGSTETGSCDTSKYVIFTNVAYYYQWIKKLTHGEKLQLDDIPKRISEQECYRYSTFAKKRSNGVCINSRSPHTVAVLFEGRPSGCSGILVSESFVLSAGHCYRDGDVMKVRIGNQIDIEVKKVIVHPLFKTIKRNRNDDLMLLELAEPVSLTSRLVPACLANEATENLYDTLLLTGFSGQSSLLFYENVDHRILSTDECNKRLARHRVTVNSSKELCVSTNIDLEDESIGPGLSGGPLQTINNRNCMFTVVGVISSGIGTSGEVLNLYGRVTGYLDWIEQTVWGHQATTTQMSSTLSETNRIAEKATTVSSGDFVFPND